MIKACYIYDNSEALLDVISIYRITDFFFFFNIMHTPYLIIFFFR